MVTENRNLTDPEEIEKALKFGEYIKNGITNYIVAHQSKHIRF